MANRRAARYYSEAEYPLGPPRDPGYVMGADGEVVCVARDTRMWVSVEWAQEHGMAVPEDWRDDD
ncbi:MAG: hypothetical protein ACRDGM_19175 [bacterium]